MSPSLYMSIKRRGVEGWLGGVGAAQQLKALTLRIDHELDLLSLLVGDGDAILDREELVCTDLRHLLDHHVWECLEPRFARHRRPFAERA